MHFSTVVALLALVCAVNAAEDSGGRKMMHDRSLKLGGGCPGCFAFSDSKSVAADFGGSADAAGIDAAVATGSTTKALTLGFAKSEKGFAKHQGIGIAKSKTGGKAVSYTDLKTFGKDKAFAAGGSFSKATKIGTDTALSASGLIVASEDRAVATGTTLGAAATKGGDEKAFTKVSGITKGNAKGVGLAVAKGTEDKAVALSFSKASSEHGGAAAVHSTAAALGG